MHECKKQHYIPQFYLRNFSIGSNGKSLGVYNINRSKYIAKSTLKNQAAENYFYGDNPRIEKSLCTIETQTAPIISKIILRSALPTRYSKEHHALVVFIIFLLMRTKYAMQETNELIDKTAKAVLSKYQELHDKLDTFKVTLKEPTLMCLRAAATNVHITYDLDYKLLLNKTGAPFFTSDNPVVLYNQFMEQRNRPGGSTGLASKGLELFMPVSPFCSILFFDKDIYRVGSDNTDLCPISSAEDIDYLNLLQYVNADRNIYFNEQISVDYIKKIALKAKSHRKTTRVHVDEFMAKAVSNDRMHSLLHTSKEDIRIGLDLTFVSLHEEAQKYRFNGKLGIVRNEELCEIHNEFLELVDRGKLKPSEFAQFHKVKVIDKNKHAITDQKNRSVNIISKKIGRNDPCPCGSGKKYKRCCGKK